MVDCSYSKKFCSKRAGFSGLTGIVGTVAVSISGFLISTSQVGTQDYVASGDVTASRSYYRISNPFDPRKGFILTNSEVADTGYNFEYCNGDRANVDIATLISEQSDCNDEPVGTWWASFDSAGLVGAPIYIPTLDESGYTQVGTIFAARMIDEPAGRTIYGTAFLSNLPTDNSADMGALLHGWTEVDVQIGEIDVQLDSNGKYSLLARNPESLSPMEFEGTSYSPSFDAFQLLLGSLSSSQFEQLTGGNEMYTIFAPSDDAINMLPQDFVAELTSEGGQRDLVEFMRNHIIPGAVDLESRSLQQASEADHYLGENLRAWRTIVSENNIQGVVTNIPTVNGPLHIIDHAIFEHPSL